VHILTLQGIKGSYDYKKILKSMKKEYCCNGTVVEDEELGQVIQVQGDQRKNIADFLTNVRAPPLLP
jgi:translation initiation factor 1